MSGTRCVPLADWLTCCREALDSGFDYFDMLSAAELIDASGVSITLHVATSGQPFAHAFLETSVRYDESLPSIAHIYAGAAWHEREIHEMFGVVIAGHPDLRPLLLAELGEYPLRKSNNLTARVETPWPGREGRRKPLGVPEDLR